MPVVGSSRAASRSTATSCGGTRGPPRYVSRKSRTRARSNVTGGREAAGASPDGFLISNTQLRRPPSSASSRTRTPSRSRFRTRIGGDQSERSDSVSSTRSTRTIAASEPHAAFASVTPFATRVGSVPREISSGPSRRSSRPRVSLTIRSILPVSQGGTARAPPAARAATAITTIVAAIQKAVRRRVTGRDGSLDDAESGVPERSILADQCGQKPLPLAESRVSALRGTAPLPVEVEHVRAAVALLRSVRAVGGRRLAGRDRLLGLGGHVAVLGDDLERDVAKLLVTELFRLLQPVPHEGILHVDELDRRRLILGVPVVDCVVEPRRDRRGVAGPSEKPRDQQKPCETSAHRSLLDRREARRGGSNLMEGDTRWQGGRKMTGACQPFR